MRMLMESNKICVVRVYMNPAFDRVMMIRFSESAVSRIKTSSEAVLMFDTNDHPVAVNLLHAPFEGRGYMPLDKKLKQYIRQRLTEIGVEIEIDERSYFVCGKITDIKQHPHGDHLHVCKVDIGSEQIDVVCGAKNAKNHMLTVVALPNAVLPNGLLIEEGTVAGIRSQGMLCSLLEITGGKKPVRGLIELPSDTVCGSAIDIAGLGETLC